MGSSEEPDFDAHSAEVFEALGHPNRIRILKALSSGPLGFSQLRREVEMESSGLLAFHLQKLNRFVKTDSGGNYTLTEEGREALRVANAVGNHATNSRGRKLTKSPGLDRVVIAALLIGLVAVGGTVVYQQGQISSLGHSVTTTTYTLEAATPIGFNYSSLPSQYTVGNFSLSVTEGVGYTLQIGPKVYTYGGFYTAFYIASSTGGIFTDVPFFWNTTAGPSTTHAPYDAHCYVLHNSPDGCPTSSTALVGIGHEVTISWAKEGSTLWVSFVFERLSS